MKSQDVDGVGRREVFPCPICSTRWILVCELPYCSPLVVPGVEDVEVRKEVGHGRSFRSFSSQDVKNSVCYRHEQQKR